MFHIQALFERLASTNRSKRAKVRYCRQILGWTTPTAPLLACTAPLFLTNVSHSSAFRASRLDETLEKRQNAILSSKNGVDHAQMTTAGRGPPQNLTTVQHFSGFRAFRRGETLEKRSEPLTFTNVSHFWTCLARNACTTPRDACTAPLFLTNVSHFWPSDP